MTDLTLLNQITEELVRRGYHATMEYPGFVTIVKYHLTFDFGTTNENWDGDVEDVRSGGVVHTDVPSDCTDVQRIADALSKAVEDCRPEASAPLSDVVARAKREILADVERGIVPRTVASFNDLHNYIDANAYGGAFEYDCHDLADIAFWSEVQFQVDAWIHDGGLVEEKPLPPAEFDALLNRVRTGELKDIEVPPPTKEKQ